MSLPEKTDLTKERILDEAETLFAEKGYHAVSVREITTAANCNLAAVNYHFGNKQNLYQEVFSRRWQSRAERVQGSFHQSMADHDSPSPTIVIQALAQAFLEGPLQDEERRRHHLLIAQELSKPTEAFEHIVENTMRPFFEQLIHHLQNVMPKNTDQDQMRLNILSIFAMVLHFNFARPLITRITGHEYDTAFKDQLVNHIINFSLNGLLGNQKETKR